MSYRNLLLLAIFSGLFTVSCTKDIDSSDCRKLQQGMTTDDIEDVKWIITSVIATLNSDLYTEENLLKLAQAINNDCSITATVMCFDCIQTLPSQSEIRLSFNSSGTTIARTIDITYTTANKMVFHNMHY